MAAEQSSSCTATAQHQAASRGAGPARPLHPRHAPTMAPLSATVRAPSVMTGALPSGCTSRRLCGARRSAPRLWCWIVYCGEDERGVQWTQRATHLDAELLEQPEDALRARVVEVVHDDGHGGRMVEGVRVARQAARLARHAQRACCAALPRPTPSHDTDSAALTQACGTRHLSLIPHACRTVSQLCRLQQNPPVRGSVRRWHRLRLCGCRAAGGAVRAHRPARAQVEQSLDEPTGGRPSKRSRCDRGQNQ